MQNDGNQSVKIFSRKKFETDIFTKEHIRMAINTCKVFAVISYKPNKNLNYNVIQMYNQQDG